MEYTDRIIVSNSNGVFSFGSDNVGIEVLTILISIAAFLFSLWSFVSERNRKRREATIHAFDELQARIYFEKFAIWNLSQKDITDLYNWAIKGRCKENIEMYNKWKNLTKQLALLEHFAVGVNAETYDISTVEAMAGKRIVRVWQKLKPIIDIKRKSDPDCYKATEKMIKEIERKNKK